MAGQPGNSTSGVSAAAHVVGNAFVNQYYNVLHQSPQVVHRFYTDASRLTRAEAGAEGAVDTVVSQSEIHQKVMDLEYGDFKAEIITVDSQDSLTGGVLVLVTGSLSNQLSGKRNFVQSFFLAPQEKGYFVLNDIFRYLDEEPRAGCYSPSFANGKADSPQGHVALDPVPGDHEVGELSTLPVREVEPTVEEIYDSSAEVEEPGVEDNGQIEDSTQMEISPVIDEPLSPVATQSATSAHEIFEEAPKKSYASIVSYASILRMKESAGSHIPSNVCNVASKATPAVERLLPYSSSPIIPSATHEYLDEGALVESEVYDFAVDGRSVYVKNLPLTISSSHLEEELRKFGVVKPGGVNIKSQKQGVCYAFVEFEDSASVQIAIEASPISVGGRQVYIEGKRQMGSRAGGRGGGRLPGTGRVDRVFRGDGLRGRPPFAGRGPGGRGTGPERDASNKGRGPGPLRTVNSSIGGGSQGNGANSGSSGVNTSSADNLRREVGTGSRPPRRGGHQNARNGSVSEGSPPVAAA